METQETADAIIEMVVAALPVAAEIPVSVRAEITDNLAFEVASPQPNGSAWVVPVQAKTNFELEESIARGRYQAVARIEVVVHGRGDDVTLDWQFAPDGVVLDREGLGIQWIPQDGEPQDIERRR